MTATTLVRFADLKKRGIVKNWTTLRRWIKTEGFPAGVKIGPNTRAWTPEEVDAYVSARRGRAA